MAAAAATSGPATSSDVGNGAGTRADRGIDGPLRDDLAVADVHRYRPEPTCRVVWGTPDAIRVAATDMGIGQLLGSR